MTTTCSHRTSHLTLTSDDVAGHYSARASSRVGCSALQHYSATWPLQHYSTTATILYSTLHHPSGPWPLRPVRGCACMYVLVCVGVGPRGLCEIPPRPCPFLT